MGKKKKRARFKPRTVWAMVIAYIVIGAVVAMIYLGQQAPDPQFVDGSAPPGSNPWALFPVFVMLWPIFLVILIAKLLI